MERIRPDAMRDHISVGGVRMLCERRDARHLRLHQRRVTTHLGPKHTIPRESEERKRSRGFTNLFLAGIRSRSRIDRVRQVPADTLFGSRNPVAGRIRRASVRSRFAAPREDSSTENRNARCTYQHVLTRERPAQSGYAVHDHHSPAVWDGAPRAGPSAITPPEPCPGGRCQSALPPRRSESTALLRLCHDVSRGIHLTVASSR